MSYPPTSPTLEMHAAITAMEAWYAPRPTAFSSLPDDAASDMRSEWISEIIRHGVTAAQFRRACDQWRELPASQYFPALNDLMPLAIRIAREDAAARELEPPSGRGCTGDGWYTDDETGESRPCPRCNIALARVWADPDKLAAWKGGSRLSELGVGVEKVGNREKLIGIAPEPCKSADFRETVPPFATGIKIAYTAYVADCAERGVDPRPFETFTKMAPR